MQILYAILQASNHDGMTHVLASILLFLLISGALYSNDKVKEWWDSFKIRKELKSLSSKAIKTRNPDLLYDLALYYSKQKNDDKAIDYLSIALEINPNHFKCKTKKLELLFRERRYFEGQNLMSDFIEYNEEKPDIKADYRERLNEEQKANILYYYGYVKDGEGKFREAKLLKQKAFEYFQIDYQIY